jgi:putative transcriptional regulator
MTPTHHPADELLVEYAAGETAEAVSLVIACHATLCPPCRQRLAELEVVGGALLEQAPPRELRPGALEAVLAALDAEGDRDGGAAVAPSAAAPSGAVLDPSWALPRPLLRYLDATTAWKRVVPGVRDIKLDAAPAGELLRLVNLRPGMTIPLHDHGGPELTLVFSGGLLEPDRVLHRGDFAIRQPGERHVQRVETGTPCIALTLNQGPLVPLTWLSRLLTFIARD